MLNALCAELSCAMKHLGALFDSIDSLEGPADSAHYVQERFMHIFYSS